MRFKSNSIKENDIVTTNRVSTKELDKQNDKNSFLLLKVVSVNRRTYYLKLCNIFGDIISEKRYRVVKSYVEKLDVSKLQEVEQ